MLIREIIAGSDAGMSRHDRDGDPADEQSKDFLALISNAFTRRGLVKRGWEQGTVEPYSSNPRAAQPKSSTPREQPPAAPLTPIEVEDQDPALLAATHRLSSPLHSPGV